MSRNLIAAAMVAVASERRSGPAMEAAVRTHARGHRPPRHRHINAQRRIHWLRPRTRWQNCRHGWRMCV